MPRARSEFDDVRTLEFHTPSEILDDELLYTVYEIGRLLQGLDPGAELDVETENVLMDWTIPWMMHHSDTFVFAEPDADDEPGYYGIDRDA